MPSLLSRPCLWLLLLVTTAYTQHLVEELSFGHKQPLSPRGSTIPGWQASSSRHNLQVLSDRAILTPPVRSNARGALWAEKPLDSENWSAEIEFRASGEETGSGSLQIWFVKDKTPIFIDSVYTVEKFDGLVLVIDQYGGRGGGVRGFLNDGTENFKTHINLKSLAFGHCDYSYRNLGRPSKLKLSQSNGLTVTIDDRDCFSTDMISLPSGYYFGVTAATAEQPDSWELTKFVVSTGTPHTHQHNQEPPPPLQKLDRFPGAPEVVPDKLADDIRSQQDQFTDLHNRLQSLNHAMSTLFAEIEAISRKMDEQHRAMKYNVPSVLHDKLDTLGRRLENTERIAEAVRRDIEGKDYREHLSKLNQAIEQALPESIGQMVSASAPRLATFVFAVLGMQIMLAVAYVLYKRRRASMPKKYL